MSAVGAVILLFYQRVHRRQNGRCAHGSRALRTAACK